MVTSLLLAALVAAIPTPRIVFSIDDGPKKATDKILDVLRPYDVSAIFFVNGYRLTSARNRARLRRIVAEGHSVGNHLWSHRSPCRNAKGVRRRGLGLRRTLRELRRTQRAIIRVVGRAHAPMLYRPPFGHHCHVRHVRRAGFTSLWWTPGAGDLGTTARAMWGAVRRRLAKGRQAVVLIHHAWGKLRYLLRRAFKAGLIRGRVGRSSGSLPRDPLGFGRVPTPPTRSDRSRGVGPGNTRSGPTAPRAGSGASAR